MKKVTLCFAVLFALLVLTVTASAAETYYIEELGLTVEVPSDHYILDRHTDDSSPALSELGLSAEYITEVFEASNIYFNAVSKSEAYEIVVTMTEMDLDDLNSFSDMLLDAMIPTAIDMFEEKGVEISDYEIYDHRQAKFVLMHHSQLSYGSTVYSTQYYTIYGGQAVNFTLHSYSGVVTPQYEELIRNVVDSVKFDTDPAVSVPVAETPAFTYTHSDSNVSFTVPANWQEDEFNEDREYLDAKFVFNYDSTMMITYGAEDALNALSEIDKIDLKRSDINNELFDYFSNSDWEEFAGGTVVDVTKVTYGGTEYFKIHSELTKEYYGLNFNLNMTQLTCVRDGWMYMFQFMGNEESDGYDDFISLVKSVNYPYFTSSMMDDVHNGSGSSGYTPQINDETDFELPSTGMVILELFISLILTISIYTVPVVIYRFAICKCPLDEKSAKKFTIIYAVIVFIIMSFILFSLGQGPAGGAIFFWSFVNYKILISGVNRRKPVVTESSPTENSESITYNTIGITMSTNEADSISDAETTVTPVRPKVRFCKHCGALLSSGAHCPMCGVKVKED